MIVIDLARPRRVVAMIAEVLTEGGVLGDDLAPVLVVGIDAGSMRGQSRHDRGARGIAAGAGAIGSGETHALGGLVDLAGETKETQEMYGIGGGQSDTNGRACLLARRLSEAGVRFVQVTMDGWDHHGDIQGALPNSCAKADRPIAGLLRDLKQRGLLDSTLIVWCGEFGRTPDNNVRGGETAIGRDHNADAMAMFFAGGGTKAGTVVGATDEIGAKAVDVARPSLRCGSYRHVHARNGRPRGRAPYHRGPVQRKYRNPV